MNQPGSANAFKHYGRLHVSVGLLLFALASAPAADIFWTNTAGGNWSVAANWSPNAVPNSSHDVFITNSGTYTVVFDNTATVHNLTLGGPSGTQTLSNNVMYLTFSGMANINTNGVLDYNDGNVSGTKNLNTGGKYIWRGGDMAGVLTIANNATLEFEGPAMKRLLSAGTITNHGFTIWRGGTFTLQGTGPFCNETDGVFDIQSGTNMCCSGDFVNAGTLLKSSGGASTIQLNFINTSTGVVSNNGGNLTLSYSVTQNGRFIAMAGATNRFASVCDCFNVLDVGHEFYADAGGANYLTGPKTRLNTGALNKFGAGVTEISGAVYCAVPITNLTLRAGSYLAGTNTVAPLGSLTLSNGYSTGFLTVESGGTLNCQGTTTIGNASAVTNRGAMLVSGLINVFTAPGIESVICNEMSGTMVLLSNASFCCSATLINKGIVLKTPGAGTNTIQLDFVNTSTGVVSNNGGNLAFTYGVLQNGRFVASSGATNRFASVCDCFNVLDVSHQFYADAGGANYLTGPKTMLNTGILNTNGAGITEISGALYCAAITNLTLGAGAFLAGTNEVRGVLNLTNTSGVTGILTVAPGATLNVNSSRDGVLEYGTQLTNYGTINWLGNKFSIHSTPGIPGAGTAIYNFGLVDIQCDQVMEEGCVFINAPSGIFRKSAGTGPSQITMNFTNYGVIEPRVGLLKFGQYAGDRTDPLILEPTSVLQFAIGGATAGSQYGQISAGFVQLAGTLSLRLTNNFIPSSGSDSTLPDTFNLISWGVRADGFTNAVGRDLNSVSNGLYFQLQVPSDRRSLIAVAKTTNNPPGLMVTNMPDQVVSVGDTAEFAPPSAAVVVQPTYQWQTNGVDLTGQTEGSLVITNCSTNDSATYCVTVMDAQQPTRTYCAALVVLNQQTLTLQPTNRIATNGSSITLTVAASSSTPLQYQWRLSGANIRNATNSTLLVTTNAQPSDGGVYDALVAQFTPQGRSRHVAVSTSAVVTVTSPALPFDDLFANAGITNARSFVGSGNNLTATNETNEPYHVGESARRSVWLRLAFPTNGVATLNTRGSTFDTRLAVYTNSAVLIALTNLVELASDDDSGGYFTSQRQFNAQPNTTYYAVVDGLSGASGQIVLSGNLDTNITAVPRIFVHPLDTATTPGGTAVFNVFASSSSPLTYQWYQGDWLAIPGATNATLVRPNVSFLDVDTYSVTVTAGGQSVESLRATLEIGPALSYDKWQILFRQNELHINSSGFASVGAGTIGAQSLNNFNSTTESGTPTHSDVVGGSDRFFLIVATNTGTMVIDTVGSDIDTVLEVYPPQADWFLVPAIASDNNSAPDHIRSLVRFPVTQTNSYLVRVDGVGGAQGNINLNYRMGTPPNGGAAAQAQMLAQGGTVALQSGVSNNVTAPSYQWWRNGAVLAGATNTSLTLSNVQFNQCGSYSVVVSNLVGAVTNVIATVSVDAPLTLAKDTNGFLLSGSATQAVTLRMSTNLTGWTPLYTNTTPLLPVSFLDTNSATRNKGFYQLKAWP